MSRGNSAVLSVALPVGAIALIMRMLGTKTPMARLPEGALLHIVIGAQLIALEAIREFGFASSTPLA